MSSCIHRVVPLNPDEHRYSIAYFLRAENETQFTDSSGRAVTAGQWHDEKFYTFTAPPDMQAAAPSYLLLGGMEEEADLSQVQLKEKEGVAVQQTPVAAF